MSEQPLRILMLERFKDEFPRDLLPPHEFRTFSNESDEEMAQIIAETDVLISGAYKAEWRDPSGQNPKLIHSVGAGLDAIDLEAVPPGCPVCNVYGHDKGVAEHAFLLFMALHKNLPKLDQSLRQGDWTMEQPYLPEMRNRNLLILGLGHIGEQLLRWGKFLEMNITVLTRNMSDERAAKLGLDSYGTLDDLDQHLPAADFVVIAIPSATETDGLIGAAQFQAMKSTAIIVNVGRGPVIDEQSLYEALKSKEIAGAGIDVWWQYYTPDEPIKHPSKYPLHELDNIIMTPHKPTYETMAFRWKFIAQNINRLVNNAPLENIVHVGIKKPT